MPDKETTDMHNQVWLSYPNGKQVWGHELQRRAVALGWATLEWFKCSRVGDVLKAGVSAYKRIQ